MIEVKSGKQVEEARLDTMSTKPLKQLISQVANEKTVTWFQVNLYLKKVLESLLEDSSSSATSSEDRINQGDV